MGFRRKYEREQISRKLEAIGKSAHTVLSAYATGENQIGQAADLRDGSVTLILNNSSKDALAADAQKLKDDLQAYHLKLANPSFQVMRVLGMREYHQAKLTIDFKEQAEGVDSVTHAMTSLAAHVQAQPDFRKKLFSSSVEQPKAWQR